MYILNFHTIQCRVKVAASPLILRPVCPPMREVAPVRLRERATGRSPNPPDVTLCLSCSSRLASCSYSFDNVPGQSNKAPNTAVFWVCSGIHIPTLVSRSRTVFPIWRNAILRDKLRHLEDKTSSLFTSLRKNEE